MRVNTSYCFIFLKQNKRNIEAWAVVVVAQLVEWSILT